MRGGVNFVGILALSGFERGEVAVSTLSQWKDKTWLFANSTPGTKSPVIKIQFDLQMPVGSRLSDDEWQYLLELYKCLVFSLLYHNSRGLNPKPISLVQGQFPFFLCFMASHGYRTFSEFGREFGKEFEQSVIEEKIRNAEDEEDQPKPITQETVARYLDVPLKVFEQRKLLEGIRGAFMPWHPYSGQNANKRAKVVAESISERVPSVPPDLFSIITKDSADFLVKKAGSIIVAHNRHLELVNLHRSASSNNWYPPLTRALLEDDNLDWLWKAFPASDDGAIATFRIAIELVKGAAYSVILAGIGIRPSELCSARVFPMHAGNGITTGDPKRDIWPHCLEIESSSDSFQEIFIFRGLLTKGRKEPVDFRWTAGARTMKTDYIPLPVLAVLKLVRLFEPWRKLTGLGGLCLTFNVPSGFPNDLRRVVAARTRGVLDSQRMFVKLCCSLPEQHRDYRITGYAWRHSFVDNVVRIDGSLHTALSEHYGHLRLAITERGYAGDPECKVLIESQSARDAGRVMWMLAQNLIPAAGQAAKMILERKQQIIDLVGERKGAEAEAVLVEAMAEEGLAVYNQSWGACLFMCERSRCHFLALGRIDETATRPHLATRAPETCRKCSNLIILLEHGPFWRSRYLANFERLSEARNADAIDIASFFLRRARQAAIILRRLGEPVPVP